jgi:hypothetical protein
MASDDALTSPTRLRVVRLAARRALRAARRAPDASAFGTFPRPSTPRAPSPPSQEHLPELLGRLQHPGADWEKWSIGDLEDWCAPRPRPRAVARAALNSHPPPHTRRCRVELRSRPHQSAIAILVVSHATGALLDLVIDSYDTDGHSSSDAALRLRKGDVEFKSAREGGRRGGRAARGACGAC